MDGFLKLSRVLPAIINHVQARVSGILTNAPFMLNVDCDMYANNPQIVLHALCLLLGAKSETESGFAQSPQVFYNGLKDDPFGNQLEVLLEVHEDLSSSFSHCCAN